MKASIHESPNGFHLELYPETIQENTKLVRLGMLKKRGAKTMVFVGQEFASTEIHFEKSGKKSACFFE